MALFHGVVGELIGARDFGASVNCHTPHGGAKEAIGTEADAIGTEADAPIGAARCQS